MEKGEERFGDIALYPAGRDKVILQKEGQGRKGRSRAPAPALT